MLMCPHCGWQYDPAEYVGKPGVRMNPYELVPPHDIVVLHPAQMSAAALESGAVEMAEPCVGEEQHPRNPETDRRPLWKDLPK